MLDTSKKEILDNTEFLNNRRNQRIEIDLQKEKTMLFLIGIILSFVMIIGFYFYSDSSKIFSICVNGNYYLNEDDIILASGLNKENRLFLVQRKKIIKKIEDVFEIIEDCNISFDNNNMLVITVKEKKAVGYTYLNGDNVLLLYDGSFIVLNESSLSLIEKVPLIMDFESEDLLLIAKNLKNIDDKIINRISEIHHYPELKYQNVEIIMQDGNYIFTNIYGLEILNNYESINASIETQENYCIYFEDISKNAYSSACPWVQETNREENKKDVE